MALLQGMDRTPASAVVAPSADYKSVDPATQVVGTRGGTALTVTINVTASSGGGGVTVTISEYDPGSDSYVTLLASTLLASTGFRTLIVSPGIATAANASVQRYLSGSYKIAMVGSGTRTTLNYSVGVTVS